MTHDPTLVAVSLLIATVASFSALELAGPVAAARGAARLWWLAGSSLAMGAGIWGMHFVAMLAFRLDVPAGYDVPLLVLSLFVAVVACAATFLVAARPAAGAGVMLLASFFMGPAIAGMHYIGMASLHVAGRIEYDSRLVGLSVLIAVTASFAALWLARRFRDDRTPHGLVLKALSALLMGLAVAGMHFTGMAAVRVVEVPGAVLHYGWHLLGTSGLAASVVPTTLLVQALALLGATAGRRLDAKAAALRESEEQYRLVFERTPLAKWLFDPDTDRFLEVNQAAVDLYGYTRQEFLGMTIRDIRPPEALTEPEAARRGTQFFAEGHQGVHQHRTKSGSVIDVEVVAYDVVLRGRRVRLVTAKDVTERRRLEEQLHEAQKMEAVGRLAGGIAHDFNNMLTAIKGFGDLLLEDLGEGDLRRTHAEEIAKAANRAAALTRKLLALGRKQVLRPEPLDLNGVIVDMEQMLRRVVLGRVEILTNLDPQAGLVEADRGQIEQVLLNLAVNARDAMPDGGVLTIRTRNETLERTDAAWAIRPGRYALLSVSDTGVGMDEATKARAFEPFFTTKPRGQGTGLGLAVVYGIVKQSGGHIWLESEPGRGTTFRIYLPQAVAATAAIAPAPPAPLAPAPAAHGTETILVVDDEEVVLSTTRSVLERANYTVISASDGFDALRRLTEAAGRVHLVVTDVVMPGMDGPELAKRIRAGYPHVRVLFVSGYTEEGVRQNGALESGDAFLEKPFTPGRLKAKVRQVLDGPAPASAPDGAYPAPAAEKATRN